jgi:hypothetical protein
MISDLGIVISELDIMISELDIVINELDIVINELDIVISQAGTEIRSLQTTWAHVRGGKEVLIVEPISQKARY